MTDRLAHFVADPFLLRDRTGWHMFFEIYAHGSQRGVISHAASSDGIHWQYDRVVLEEPFHLSYPHVFEHDGEFYMTPESGGAGEVRLYRADNFPGGWRLDTVLLRGDYYDPTLLQHDGRWWMWVCDANYTPLLFTAVALRGPWMPHECNARARPDLHHGRPGGRVLVRDDGILRFVQDSIPTYGSCLHAMKVERLETQSYTEAVSQRSPVLQGKGDGWRATGMHHMDAWPVQGGWIAAVDGNRQRRVYNWRAGARLIQRRLLAALRRA